MSDSNRLPNMQIQVPQVQAAERIIVTVERKDGRIETLEALGGVNYGVPGVVVFPTAEGHIAYAVEELARWEAIKSPISVMRAH